MEWVSIVRVAGPSEMNCKGPGLASTVPISITGKKSKRDNRRLIQHTALWLVHSGRTGAIALSFRSAWVTLKEYVGGYSTSCRGSSYSYVAILIYSS